MLNANTNRNDFFLNNSFGSELLKHHQTIFHHYLVRKKNLFKMYFSILNSFVPKVPFLKQTTPPAAQIFHDKSTSIGPTLTFRTLWVRIERPNQPHYTLFGIMRHCYIPTRNSNAVFDIMNITNFLYSMQLAQDPFFPHRIFFFFKQAVNSTIISD